MPIHNGRQQFADLHIHIGRAGHRPVKITASPSLTLRSIIFVDAPRKGLDIVGIVDAGSPLVMGEIEAMLDSGALHELSTGGFMAGNGVLLITGVEIETSEGIHVIVYLPDCASLRRWQRYISARVTNNNLSTQKADLSTVDILATSLEMDGIFCLAHAFTPHKGAYGAWTDNLAREIGSAAAEIKVIELGLSADSLLADTLSETQKFHYLSNSDAHSGPNVGREYNCLQMCSRDFEELRLAILGEQGRKIEANYGLHPRLGKYRRSYCPHCDRITGEAPPVTKCPQCGSDRMVIGVLDRLVMIQDRCGRGPVPGRPPYHYRVPLHNLPGIGPVAHKRLLTSFTNEIQVMETVPLEDIQRVAGERVAAAVQSMRQGTLLLRDGGGGHYGKVAIPAKPR